MVYDQYVPNQHLEVGAITEQALWEDVADGVRASIDSGEYAAKLPSEVELAEQYHVSRDTVRRALRKLTEQGLLTPGARPARQEGADKQPAYGLRRPVRVRQADERAPRKRR